MQSSVFLTMVNVSSEDWSHKIDDARKVVGRSREAKIRVPPQYETISRRHAELWCCPSGIWVQDLNSRGGTRVNGLWLSRGAKTRVLIGDRITFSDVEFHLVEKVSKLAELLVETEIGCTLIGEENPGSTTINPKRGCAEVVRMTLAELSPSELDIMLWMYRGYTGDIELSLKLHRSPNTVRTQVASIFDKLGVRSRTDIVTWLKRADAAPQTSSESKRPVEHATRAW